MPFPHPSPGCRAWYLSQCVEGGSQGHNLKLKPCCHCCKLCCSQGCTTQLSLPHLDWQLQLLSSSSSCPVLGQVLPFKLVVQILLQLAFLLSILCPVLWGILLTSSHHFYSRDLSYQLGFCQVLFIVSRSLNSLVQCIGPSTTVRGWCTPAKSRPARNMNCRDASSPPSRDTVMGWFILSQLLPTTYFVMLHEGNACHRLGRTVLFYTWLYLE